MMVARSFSTGLSRVLRVLPPSASTPRVRLPSARSCEPGLQICSTVVSVQTLLVRVQSIHPWRIGKLPTCLRGLCHHPDGTHGGTRGSCEGGVVSGVG